MCLGNRAAGTKKDIASTVFDGASIKNVGKIVEIIKK
jgi:hypothetical protein